MKRRNFLQVSALTGGGLMLGLVPEREAAIIRQAIAHNHGPLDGDAIRRLFEAVIAESTTAESAMLEG